ncbi:hypothetical protein BH10BDE1_BH10BDE1_18500 [soil metagenome]
MILQQLKSRNRSTLAGANALAGLVFVTSLFLTPWAHAVPTVTVGNASIVDTTGTAITVYGGTAGSTDRCLGGISNSTTCNNCALKTGETGATGDAFLLACNERRIHENLQFVITVRSDAIAGKPSLTNAEGTVSLASSPAVAKGSIGTITVPWSTICTTVITADTANSGGISGSACSSFNGYAAGQLRVGISADGGGLLNATGDDVKTISFVIRNVAANIDGNLPSLSDNCAGAGIDSEICYFELGPGDEKAVVRTLQAPYGSSFPSSAHTQFRYVRFLWAEGDFANINVASAHADLLVTGSDVATFDVTPRRIEGLLTNDTTYYFKSALIDAAGNVGLYSPAAYDHDCTSAPDPASTDCRIVTPSEVVGVLDKTNCFIATAAYGGQFGREIEILRDFRDQILSRSDAGHSFIRWYYDHSPRYAKMILNHPMARATVRAALVPVVWFAGFTLTYGPMKAGLAFLASLIVLAALIGLARRKAVHPLAGEDVVKVRKDARRSLLPIFFAALLLPAMAANGLLGSTAHARSSTKAKSNNRKPAQTVTPLEELQADAETPPEPEYPYPGAQGNTTAPSTAAKKKTQTPKVEDNYPADILDTPNSDLTGNSADHIDAPADRLETPSDRAVAPSDLDAPIPADVVEPEPPYIAPVPAPRARRPRYTGTKPRDPNKSPYQKPKMVNEDGDYIYEKTPDVSPREYGPPKRPKFSKLPGREAPSSISMDGEFNYPVKSSPFSGAAGIRFGMMSPPNITNSSNGLTFKDIYGKADVPALLFEYEYPLTRAIGRIGIKFETGAYATKAAGRFKNPTRLNQIPEEKFTFVMIPLQAVIHYRFQFADSQLFVPFVEGGAGYNGIVELRDDNKTPRFGGAPALVAGGGVNILLDWIDRRSVRQLDAEYGINHVWFTAQYRQTVGLKSDLDISSHLISAGFTFDY